MSENKNKNKNGELSCDAKQSFGGNIENKESMEEFEVSKTAQDEEGVLNFWLENKIFEKSLEQRKGKKEFVFYDGPPFATGLPHYGHLLAGTIKDIIPRYQTMKGYLVKRNWGWDCHGLPIENMIEAELQLDSKKDIEEYGIDKFNQKARDSVLRYDEEWKKIVPKTGRWVDMSKPYKTMDATYTESLWWAFKELYKKGLVEKNFKPMHICPRCETTLSNNEVTEGYQDIKDLTVTAKFKLLDEENTFVLAWTTTPWTLPGNVALAVGNDIDYVKIKKQNEDGSGEVNFILAKEKLEEIFSEQEYEIVTEMKGSELVGKSYESLFDYYSKDKNLKNRENGWKIYAGDFVDTETGTGIVHLAPAFGEDDLKMGQEYNLPFVQHVKMNGEFQPEVTHFAGMKVRKKDFHEEADIEIIKYLAHQGKLFAKKKYEHSYPHCWRCKTPLLNYATSSWFINSPQIKEQLVAENKKVHWVPEHIGTKRFHNWLDNTKPWAVSRSRYWGAPLPVWENQTTGEFEFIGSLAELKEKTKSTNNFTFLRHGESESNVKNMISSTIGMYGDKLTPEGKKQVEEVKKDLKNIDLIFVSPFERTKQTAEIIGGEEIEIREDERLQEIKAGNRDGKSWTDKRNNEFDETDLDVKKRSLEFLYEIDKKYQNKNILIISHGIVGASMLDVADSCENVKNATIYPVDFAPIPHNENYELDFHRPYIDQISWNNEKGEKYEFIKEVFDCWFESGSMPFASKHYPFENKEIFNPKKGIGFPANFIAEGEDQTRGWFNTMLILSTALFGETSFQNVIVNGTILAEDGKKMSKSLKNYPDVNYLLHKFGGDAMRLYMIGSPAVRAESLAFTEKGVDEVMKKVIMKSKNILAFYNLYKKELITKRKAIKSPNILDQWIIVRTNKLIEDISSELDKYELDSTSKIFIDYIDDLSTWYIRRSRDRFKGSNKDDRDFVISTTEEVITILAQVIAPFAPFIAEFLWQEIKNEKMKESVHLTDWPEVKKSLLGKIVSNDQEILEQMDLVREIVSLGMEQRTIKKMKVRQPLRSATVKGDVESLLNNKQIIEIIEDELNIKELNFKITKEEIQVELDIELTPELKEEGNFREFVRLIQTMRKKAGLEVKDRIELKIDLVKEERGFIENYRSELEKIAGVTNINYAEIDGNEQTQKINQVELKVILVK